MAPIRLVPDQPPAAEVLGMDGMSQLVVVTLVRLRTA